MDDEPSLPQLPPSLPADTRKRGRDMAPPPTHSSTSSDPAFFSSDDDPALDNYQSHGRRKRRYRGAWFDQHPASSDSAVGGEDTRLAYSAPRRDRHAKPQKREFRRQLDSGVWMGTDGSLTDTDDAFDLEPAAARLPLAHPRVQVPVPLSPARPRLTPQEQEVQSTIRFCVEHGTEQVDLSGLGLDSISDGLLDPISDIAPIPNVTKDVEFEQRDPQIQVFLSNNRLRSFPVALFNVEHLTVLSLRANQLSRIPPAIGKLKNLEALNVAQNYLNYLPGELLDLLRKGRKLRSLNFQPNRFWQPDTASLADNRGAEKYEQLTYGSPPAAHAEAARPGLTTRLHSRTPVHFLDSAQTTYSSFRLRPLDKKHLRDGPVELEPFTALATPRELARERSHAATSKVINPRGAKSLFELALRACASSAQADRIAAWLREGDDCPPHFAAAVDRAVDIHREGGLWCAVCRRETVVPLAQWLEFWHIGLTTVVGGEAAGDEFRFVGVEEAREGQPVPFLRVGCSWECVPVRVEEQVVAEEGDA